MSTSPDSRTAFVLMPFEEPFEAIYTSLVSPALAEAGYKVRRADSVLDQQNVLKDIVTGIDAADLIVADLTDLNPNVFYELGIAHGLGIPTVLLTQAMDDVPFDLRTYRVKEYSARFDKAAELQAELTKVATEHAKGGISFGSPVSDFLPNGHAAKRLSRREKTSASAETLAGSGDELSESDEADEDEDGSTETKGLLDLLSDVIAAGEAIETIGSAINEEMTSFTEKLAVHTANIERAAAKPGSSSVSSAQVIARAVAHDLEAYAMTLKPRAAELNENAHLFSDSSLVWVSRVAVGDEEKRGELEEYRGNLVDLKEIITNTREGMTGFREAVAETNGWSMKVDRANRKVLAQLDALISTFDYLLAFTSRGLEIVDERLSENEGGAPEAP